MKELANKSHEHLSRSFKKYLKKTPTSFICELRLNYAANLLSTTDNPIIQIAYETGFDNLGYFFNKFKEYYNTTPSKFRANNKRSL